MTPTFILIIILVALAFYVVGVYNSLQTMLTRIKASIQEIGNQLKRQVDLIPNLEESVKGYLKHEKDVFKMLTDARKLVAGAAKSGSVSAMSEASDKLTELLPRLQVVVESNPELKASETVTRLMEELRDTADKVMYARRTLIDLSADYNIKLVTFPSNLVANMFGFKPEKGLEVADTAGMTSVSSDETKTPRVNLS